MGRKSLLASTTKEKAATKKKRASKKSAKAAPGDNATKKNEARIASESKKAGAKAASGANAVSKGTKSAASKAKSTQSAKKKAPAKKASAKKAPAKKASTAEKKKVTLKDLIFKRFVSGKTEAKPIKVDKEAVKIPEAPAFVSGYGKDETQQIRRLLFRQFDLKAATPPARKEEAAKKAPAKKAPAKKASAAEDKKVTLKDLIFKRFVSGKTEAKPIKVERDAVKIPEAPAFVSGYGKDETEQIRRLLFRQFDLKAATPVKKTEGVAVETVPIPVPSEPPPYEPVGPSGESAGTGSTNKAMRMGLLALAFLIAIIVAASFSNRSKFYLKEVDNGVEVWRGKFAPAGTELVYKLDGVTLPEPLQESYTQKEVSPIFFGFFLNKADAVLNVPAGPDIAKMKEHLRHAATFAPSQALQTQIQRRLKGVDFIIAFHKADVALSKGTMPDLREAKASLSRAYSSATTDSQRELVEKTQAAVDEAMALLKTT